MSQGLAVSTARIRSLREGNVFSLFVYQGEPPCPVSGGGIRDRTRGYQVVSSLRKDQDRTRSTLLQKGPG